MFTLFPSILSPLLVFKALRWLMKMLLILVRIPLLSISIFTEDLVLHVELLSSYQHMQQVQTLVQEPKSLQPCC